MFGVRLRATLLACHTTALCSWQHAGAAAVIAFIISTAALRVIAHLYGVVDTIHIQRLRAHPRALHRVMAPRILPLKEANVGKCVRPSVFLARHDRIIRSVPPACRIVEVSDEMALGMPQNLGRLIQLTHTSVLYVRPQTVDDARAVDAKRDVDIIIAAPARKEAVIAACARREPEARPSIT